MSVLTGILLLVPLLVGVWLVRGMFAATAASGPSLAQDVSVFNPRTLLGDDNQHFLPSPVAALPAERNAGPPARAAADQPPAPVAAREQVKVANTGGAGAILRASPPKGPQVASLRDGEALEVLDRQSVGDDEWLHVKTARGAEGWIYGRLVGPAG